jgi:hypothetical protein
MSHLHGTIGFFQVLHKEPNSRTLLLECRTPLQVYCHVAAKQHALATRCLPVHFHVPESPLTILSTSAAAAIAAQISNQTN